MFGCCQVLLQSVEAQLYKLRRPNSHSEVKCRENVRNRREMGLALIHME